MFPIQAKSVLPVSRLVIRSVSVRGNLGPMTVWVTNVDALGGHEGNEYSLHRLRYDASSWTKIYDKSHDPSRRQYEVLDLSRTPIILEPGQTRLIYIHSAAENDLSVVYDNSRTNRSTRYTDNFLTIHSGAAHLSPEPFDRENIWGWGGAWRDRREFVGQIDFGAIYQLWSPDKHLRFGTQFQDATTTLLACQRHSESPIAMLPDECIYYILNMCRYDWFDDSSDQIGNKRRSRQKRADRSKRSSEGRSEQSRSRARRSSNRWNLSFIGGVREKLASAFS